MRASNISGGKEERSDEYLLKVGCLNMATLFVVLSSEATLPRRFVTYTYTYRALIILYISSKENGRLKPVAEMETMRLIY